MSAADTIRRCKVCGRPRATADDWERYSEGEGTHLCWDGIDADCLPVDAGALLAENERLREVAEAARALSLSPAPYATLATWERLDRALDALAAVPEERP